MPLHASPSVTIALAVGTSALVSVASDRIRLPALLPLLGVGLVLGRSWADVVDTEALGPMLSPMITLGIGLLVFEGALHLTRRELGRAPRAVMGLLTVGTLLTWIFSALAAVLVLGYGAGAALLLGAMLTVTGPTVVQPILRRVRLTAPLRTALSAESILVDPIGVLLTIVILSVLKVAAISPMSAQLILDGAKRMGFPVLIGIGVGLVIGMTGRLVGRGLGRRGRANPRHLNILAMGICMLAVGVGEMLQPEAGLVAAAISAMCMATLKLVGISELHAFKEQLASLTVGTLFVLLAARFDAHQLTDAGPHEFLFAVALIFAVRPISSTAALVGSRLVGRERGFVALFAPRGVVALSMAVIVADDLKTSLASPPAAPGQNTMLDPAQLSLNAESFERVMFIVIALTVLWASIAAPLLARALRVGGSLPSGVLLIGGHRLSIECALALQKLGVEVTMVDSHYDHLIRAEAAGLNVVRGDATDLRWLEDQVDCTDIGLVLAWTGNRDVDFTVARWASERMSPRRAGVWASGKLPPDAPWTEIGGGRLLPDTLDEFDVGHWKIGAWSESESSSVAFLAIEEGRPRFILPGESIELAAGGQLLGLVRPGS